MLIKIMRALLLAMAASGAVHGAPQSPEVPISIENPVDFVQRLKSIGRTEGDIAAIPQLIAEYHAATEDAKFDYLAVLHMLVLNRQDDPAVPSESWDAILDFCFEILSVPSTPALHMAVRSVLMAGDDLEVVQRAMFLLDHEAAGVRYNGISLLIAYADRLDADNIGDALNKAAADPDPNVSNAAALLISRLALMP